MTPSQLVAIQDLIERLWTVDTDWELDGLVEQFDLVEYEHAIAAVRSLFDEGRAFPPRPPEVHAKARQLHTMALRDQRMHRSLPPPEGVTGPEGLRRFAETHEGLSPTQWARRLAGLPTGEPAAGVKQILEGDDGE